MKVLMAIGILIALCATAAAEPPPVFYEGSRCFRIDKQGKQAGFHTIKVPSLILPTSEVAEDNRTFRALDVCIGELAECRAVKKPESRWLIGAKWATVGAAIGAAFVAGVWVGR